MGFHLRHIAWHGVLERKPPGYTRLAVWWGIHFGLTTYTIESNSTTVILTVHNIDIPSTRLKVIAPKILFSGFDTTLLRQNIHF